LCLIPRRKTIGTSSKLAIGHISKSCPIQRERPLGVLQNCPLTTFQCCAWFEGEMTLRLLQRWSIRPISKIHPIIESYISKPLSNKWANLERWQPLTSLKNYPKLHRATLKHNPRSSKKIL
jgi:hypothetical protein